MLTQKNTSIHKHNKNPGKDHSTISNLITDEKYYYWKEDDLFWEHNGFPQGQQNAITMP